MNIYLKIDSILEQKNKRFEDRYEVIETNKGFTIMKKQPFEFAELPQFNKCRGGLSLTKGIVIVKEGQENMPDYLKRVDL